MATTLKGFAQESRDRYSAMGALAQSDYSQATDDLAAANSSYSTLVTEYAALERDIAAKRAAMAEEGLMPSDIEVLAGELRDLMIDLRAKRAELLEAEEAKIWLSHQKDQVEQQLSTLTSQVAAAEEGLTEAEDRDDQHTNWKQSVSDGDISTLQTRATELLDARAAGSEPEDEEEALIWNAKQRIDGDIPSVLLVRARERGAQIKNKFATLNGSRDDLEDRIGTQSAADSGVIGLSTQRWIAFERAEASFMSLVLQSQSHFDQVVALLTSVKQSTVLSAAETARTSDVSLAVDADAVVNEKARDDAQDDVSAKQAEIEEALLDAMVADINADPEIDPTVIAKRAELVPLEAALASAEGDYDAAMHNEMDLWEGAVPDHIWANLVAYDRAELLLTTLKDADAAALSAAMDAAESSLVAALEAEDEAARLNDALESGLDLAAAWSSELNNSYQAQMLSRVRGDN